MNALQKLIAILGRGCLSLIFILAAIQKIIDWQGTERVLTNALCDLMSRTPGVEWIQELITFVLPWVPLCLVVATFFELGGGILLLLGIRVRLGAFLLLLFLIPTTLVFHHFWLLQADERALQMIMFLKNLSIFGGLLIVLSLGTGGKSVKKQEDLTE